MPEAARRPTKAGAIALSRYYWTLVNYAQDSRDTAELNDLTRDCRACDGGKARLDRIFLAGGVLSGGHHTVRSARGFRAPVAGKEWLIDQHVFTEAERVTKAGQLDGSYRSGTLRIFMTVTLAHGRLAVTSWHVEAR